MFLKTKLILKMFIAGANVFNQWLLCDKILYKLQEIPRKDSKVKTYFDADTVCISWSYNILKIAEKFFISGSWKGRDSQFVTLPLPENNTEESNLLIACNDYKVVMIYKNNNIWILDLKTENFQRVCITESPNFNIVSNELQSNDNIIKAKVTGDLCAYLTKEGNVYTGYLPCYIATNHCMGKVCDIECGYEHYVLLTDIGSVYTWGTGRRLQLGHGDLENTETPTEVKALAGIKINKIRANGWHTLALSESGDLYAWGWNDTGQIGVKFEDDVNFSGVPTLITIYDQNGIEVELNVKDIACGTRHSAILLEDNSVWTAGSNKYGQLGFSPDVTNNESFKKCFVASQEAKILCGPWCTVVRP